MILQDIEIVRRLVHADERKRIIITPLSDPAKQIGCSSVDVRLGVAFRVPVTSHMGSIDPYREESVAERYLTTIEVPAGEAFFLHPREFVMASTLEYVRVPYDLACRLEGRSSWGRLGLLVHATAGFIDPGFSGNLTFELYNAGRLPIEIRPGYRMAQLCFMKLVDEPRIPYDLRPGSKYNRQLGAEASRIWRDKQAG
jgi:dCTP deaminase